jgi:hypothetical protein
LSSLLRPSVVSHLILRGLFVLLLPAISSPAQVYDTASKFNYPVALDTFVVRSGFDIDAFIRRVRNDSTFYKAFRSMHLVPYSAQNDIRVLDKRGDVFASWNCKTRQELHKKCRITQFGAQTVTGDFFESGGAYRYYTASLYDYLFFARKQVCNENDIVAGAMEAHGEGRMEQNKYQLKQLIFNPGSRIHGVPFLGDRESIFDAGEREKYDFRIRTDSIDGQECYLFTITPKKGMEHRVIYNDLTTWFRKSDYAILARNYSLSYHTLFYDFDVTMKVRTTLHDGRLLPNVIDYDGNWHIFTKKRERVRFRNVVWY